MEQVVDLQASARFQELGVDLVAISPDPPTAWRREGTALGITTPMLSDTANKVWVRYGSPEWLMGSGEPGHTFFLVDANGTIAWVRDYGAPENGGAMYVEPAEVAGQVAEALGPEAES